MPRRTRKVARSCRESVEGSCNRLSRQSEHGGVSRCDNPSVDTVWALEQCREWQRLHERVPIPNADSLPRGTARSHFRGSREERSKVSHRLELVAEAVFNSDYRWRADAQGVRELIFELEEGLQVRERLGLMDDPAPKIAANTLHPWVWDAARPHWQSGNHDAAVWAAAINVNTTLQSKVHRPGLGEVKLVQEAFSTKPPEAGRARLRLCDESNPALFNDRHIGAISLGTGLFLGVRNPLNHVGAADLSEHEALETLASWSLFARWVDRATVEAVQDDVVPQPP